MNREVINKDFVTMIGEVCSARCFEENAYACMINGKSVINEDECNSPRDCATREGRGIKYMKPTEK